MPFRKDSCNSDTTLYDHFNQIIDFYQPEEHLLKDMLSSSEIESTESKELPSVPTRLDGNETFTTLINDLLSLGPLGPIEEETSDMIEGEFKITYEHDIGTTGCKYKKLDCKSEKRWVIIDVDGSALKICVSFRDRRVEVELDFDSITNLEKVSRNKFMFTIKANKICPKPTLVLFECASFVVSEKIFMALEENIPSSGVRRRFSLEQRSKFQSFMDQVKKSISFRRPSLA